jgi:hypothetical protein
MEITGKLHSISKLRQVTPTFSVQEFILDTSSYNQETGDLIQNYAQFQINNQRVSLDGLKVGQKLKISFYIKGKLYEKKDGSGLGLFQSLTCFKLTDIEENRPETQNPTPKTRNSIQPKTIAEVLTEDDNDLPF